MNTTRLGRLLLALILGTAFSAVNAADDKHGYDKHGYDKHGYDKHGYDKHGYRSNCTRANFLFDPFGVLDPEDPVTGRGLVCANRHGVKGRLRLRNLVPGDAYTVWWVYFDDPSQCATPGFCDVPDFYGDKPQAVLGRFGSVVAGRRGKANIYGSWSGMRPSGNSDIRLLVFGHGPADFSDGAKLARQLLTPEDPSIGVPHLGNNVDGPGFVPIGLTIHVVD